MKILYENKKIVGIVLVLLVVGIIGLTFLFNNKEEEVVIPEVVTINLTLFGNSSITLNQGEEYVEPGYYAINSKGVIETNRVEVSNNLDINIPGVYTITYRIDNVVKTRTITVLEKEEMEAEGEGDVPSVLKFYLLGESTITIPLGSSYEEPGYKAFIDDIDITEEVEIEGEIDTNIPGTYVLTYSVEDNNKVQKLTRTIIVVNN